MKRQLLSQSTFMLCKWEYGASLVFPLIGGKLPAAILICFESYKMLRVFKIFKIYEGIPALRSGMGVSPFCQRL